MSSSVYITQGSYGYSHHNTVLTYRASVSTWYSALQLTILRRTGNDYDKLQYNESSHIKVETLRFSI